MPRVPRRAWAALRHDEHREVTTPSEVWPITGIARLLLLAVADPRIAGPAAWPDEPWWKLSGLFDLTAGQSLQAGAVDLEAAMAAHGNDNLVIYGYSMGAGAANVEKHKLAEQYPAGTQPPVSTSSWPVTPMCPTAA